jgi:periplasmic copper chaperone A
MIRILFDFLRGFERTTERGTDQTASILRRFAFVFGLVVIASFAASFIHPEPMAFRNDVSITHPWSKGGAVRQQSMPIYMTIENKRGVADELLHIESPMADDFVIASVAKKEGTTKQSATLAIPPRERVVLRPGQIAITLVNLNATIQPGEHIPISLIFERAGKLEVRVRVENLGEPEHPDHF